MDEQNEIEQIMRRIAFSLRLPSPEEVSIRQATPQQLMQLAASSDRNDRLDAAVHPDTPRPIRNVLARDEDENVACAAVMGGADYPEARPDMLISNWPREFAKLALASGDAALFEQLSSGWTGSAAELLQAVRDVSA